MISRELEILNIIHRLGGQCSKRIISKEMRLSPDYIFLIAKKLLDRKLIKKIANNAFILTVGGRSFLERGRGGSEGKTKTSSLMAVSRSFDGGVELPSFNPEIHFINPAERLCLVEHNLGKDLTIEVTDARSIQKSLKRLAFNRKKSEH